MDFMFKALENFFQRTHPWIFVVIVNGLRTIVYKKTDEWYIEWQRITTSGATNDNEWQRVVQRVRTNDNELQQMAISDSEWQQVIQRMKRHSTLQRMNDWHPYYHKNRYTTSSFRWLQIKWLSKETALKVFQEKLSSKIIFSI